MWIVDYLTKNGYCETNGEARRLIRSGEVKVDGAAVNEEDIIVFADPKNRDLGDRIEIPSDLGREYLDQRALIQERFDTNVKAGDKVWVLADYSEGYSPEDPDTPVPTIRLIGKKAELFPGRLTFMPEEIIYKKKE